ncbi:MAG: biotin--[acetyl-CoA-carboxylase] ligase [Deltaproteobacteria bacterium]|nr:biotin--[acetyl-CoA-carboxylase] ligase [Deltaproteobacteria bacterium]
MFPEQAVARIMDQSFNKTNLKKLVSGGLIGNRIHFFDEIDSTNNHAVSLAGNGAGEGEVVIADCQTAGRGRLRDRIWHSPPGRNLYTSIILKPDVQPAHAQGLTLVAGVAVAELLSAYCPVALKWPNDILAGGRKISGILTEMRIRGRDVDFVVVGIGININMEADDFQGELLGISTSLKEQTSNSVSRLDLTAGLYRSFEKWYRTFIDEGFLPVRERWMEYSDIIGKTIEVTDRSAVQSGTCRGIDSKGMLLLGDEENRTRRVLSGDVSVTKNG